MLRVQSLLLCVVCGELLVVVKGQLSTGIEEHGRGRLEREEETSRLLQQLESIVTSLNERFVRLDESWTNKFEHIELKLNGLEQAMNNVGDTLSEVKGKQLETHQQVNKLDGLNNRLGDMKRNLSTQLDSTRQELTQNQMQLKNMTSAIDINQGKLSEKLAHQAMTSQSNHAAQMNRLDNVVSVIESKTEDLQQFCLNTVTTKFIEPVTISSRPPQHVNNDGDVIRRNRTSATPTLARIVPGDYKNVLAVALLRDELFVTRQQDNYVSVYDATSLQLNRTITIPRFGGWAEGLAVDASKNYLYVTDTGNNYVHRIDLASNNILVLEIQCSKRPRGISVNSRRNILVACFRSIQEHTPDGALASQLSDTKNDILVAVETVNRTLLVIDNGPVHAIERLTRDGHVISSYGNSFRAMAVASSGYILVADLDNDRVQVVNPSLTAARTLPLNVALTGPIALCYDESRGRLYVAEYSGQGRLLAFDHVTNLEALFV